MKKYEVFDIESKELQRTVRVSVYLPKEYYQEEKSYPVLYMHDGQNLFDDQTAFANKSWGIIDTFEKDDTLPKLIVVGINSSNTRSDELVPFSFFSPYENRYSGGKSDIYYNFILTNVKEKIDSKYRTLKEKEHTGIMGSSYGGLSSTYAALKYSDYFSKFACVSNAYFSVQEELEQLIKSSKIPSSVKLYMDVGTKETQSLENNKLYIQSNKTVYKLLGEKIEEKNLQFNIIEGAIHHESEWEKRFPRIIEFLFGE